MKHSMLCVTLFLCCFVLYSCSANRQSNSQSPTNETTEVYCFQRKSNSGSEKISVKQSQGAKLIEGNIKGLIVQRGEIKQSPSKEDSSKVEYVTSYFLTNGNEIAAIDEDGINQQSDKVMFLTASQVGTPPDDTDVIQTGVDMPEGMMFGARTKAGGMIFRVGGRSASKSLTKTETLLGEFRIDPNTKKGRIIPALEIETANGLVTIPVSSIVKFKEKAEQPTP